MHVVAIIAIGLFVLSVLWIATHSPERFRIEVRDGRCRIVRGQLPPALLGDIRDAIARAGVERATIRAVRHGRGVRIVARGLDAGTVQRLRNLLGVHGLGGPPSGPGSGGPAARTG